jgi:hypothetical protein
MMCHSGLAVSALCLDTQPSDRTNRQQMKWQFVLVQIHLASWIKG